MINQEVPCIDKFDIANIAEVFVHEGCVRIPQVLTAEQVAVLRTATDAHALNPNPSSRHSSYAGNAFVLRQCEELGPVFADMITHPTLVAIAEAVLGPGAAFNAMNVIRNGPGQAISNWHIDDVLEFPLPDDVPRFDARIRMPVFWFTVQVALSDIDSLEHGPTQYVPASHYSGRMPSQSPDLIFEGRGPVAMFCKAGDIYLTNHQTQYLKSWLFSRFSARNSFYGLQNIAGQSRNCAEKARVIGAVMCHGDQSPCGLAGIYRSFQLLRLGIVVHPTCPTVCAT